MAMTVTPTAVETEVVLGAVHRTNTSFAEDAPTSEQVFAGAIFPRHRATEILTAIFGGEVRRVRVTLTPIG